MSKIRMNTEFRNKFLNRYVDYAEKEITQESDGFNDAREKVDSIYPKAFELAKEVVSRAYPSDDICFCLFPNLEKRNLLFSTSNSS